MTTKKIGIALSGGGARGFSHLGALQILVEHEIPIDLVAGTSAGAIIGAAFASGMNIDDIGLMAARIGWLNMVRPALSRMAFLSNAPMGRFLRKYFPVIDFASTRLPFTAVACDLRQSQRVDIQDGDLITAVRASCAVPGVFTPVRGHCGRMLVDGGVIAPLPTAVARQMGADIVIAVDLMACGATFRPRPRSGMGIAIQSTMTMLRTISETEQKLADVVIKPAIAHLRPDKINARNELIGLGRQAAEQNIDLICKIIAG